MKKGLIFVLFALVSVVSFSQISWNAKVGMTMNNVTKVEDSKMKLGYTFGVGVDYAFSDMWSVQSGLMFASKGTKIDLSYSEDGDTESDEYKINPVYLEIPILAAVKFPISDNMKFIVNVGPYVAFGLGGKTTNDYSYTSVDYPEDNESGSQSFKLFSKEKDEDGNEAEKAALKRFDLGLQYGIGLEFGHYLVNLSGQYGFINPVNEKGYLGDFMYDKNEKKISPKNMSFAISVGYKF